MILAHLKFDIFTSAFTFHHTTIGYHNLKVGYSMYITMALDGHSPVNKIVGAVAINQNNHLVVFDVANQL